MSALHVLGIVVLDSGTDQEKADDSADLTAPGRNAVRRVRGMAQPGDAILQLRITLAQARLLTVRINDLTAQILNEHILRCESSTPSNTTSKAPPAQPSVP